jgi:ABC-type bacteriocin/lantibiotic exporter with double-glycine peptidase domain
MEDYIKIKYLIGKKNIFKIYFIIFLQIIVSLSEIIGISIFFPLFTLLSSPENFNNLAIVKKISNLTNITEDYYFIVILTAFAVIFSIKFVLQLLISLYEVNFFTKLKIYLSEKLLDSFFIFNYDKAEGRENNKLLNLMISEVERFIHKVIGCIISIVSEFFLYLGIIAMLAYFSSFNILFICIFYLSIIGFIFLLSKSYLKKLSLKRIYHQEKSILLTKEVLDGFKDIKIYNAEKILKNNFIFNMMKLTNINRNFDFLEKTPRFFIEFVSSIILIVVFLSIYYFLNLKFSDYLPVLAVYGVSAIRLLPSTNRILSNIQGYKTSQNVLHEIYQNVFLENVRVKNEVLNFKNKLKLNNVSFKYKNEKNNILVNFNLEIKKGEYIGIYGKSGSGKTTLLNILMGFLKPTSGFISVDGKTINKRNVRKWHSKMSYVGQYIFLLKSSLIKNIVLNQDNFNIDKLKTALKVSQLEKYFKNSSKNDLGESGSMVSGGERQRIGIARAIYSSSEILILDEPTSALDNKNELNFFKEINKYKKEKTIILVTHKKYLLSNCDKVIQFQDNGVIKIT